MAVISNLASVISHPTREVFFKQSMSLPAALGATAGLTALGYGLYNAASPGPQQQQAQNSPSIFSSIANFASKVTPGDIHALAGAFRSGSNIAKGVFSDDDYEDSSDRDIDDTIRRNSSRNSSYSTGSRSNNYSSNNYYDNDRNKADSYGPSYSEEPYADEGYSEYEEPYSQEYGRSPDGYKRNY
jgi:hypothetical protein